MIGVKLKGIQHDEAVDCVVCGRQVMRRNDIGHEYCYCNNCSLTLHMECALSCNDDYAKTSSRKSYVCKPCEEGVTDKSVKCKACQFNKHLQIPGGHSPIAIKHFDTKDHFLTILLDNNIYRCFACGENSEEGLYLCKDCGVAYHYECVTLPRQVKNVHGGHHHHMSLKFESEEAEDYLCQECQELRDPSLWYYSCEDCPGYELHPSCVAKLRKWKGNHRLAFYKKWMDKAEMKAANKVYKQGIEMKESESIADFYSRMIYLIQWYGQLRGESGLFEKILGALPLKFYHIVVAIKRSEEYKSITVDQLMIYLRIYKKRIDNGEDVLIELVLANLYATQQSSSRDNYSMGNWDERLIMNVEDVSYKAVLNTDYSKQESGDNWIKYWGKYWDNYWFNYQRGYYRSQDKPRVQCSICKMFGHDPTYCWSVLDIVTEPLSPETFDHQINCKIQSKE